MKQKLKEGNMVILSNPTSGKQFKVRILRLLDYNTRAVVQFHDGEDIIVSTEWLKK